MHKQMIVILVGLTILLGGKTEGAASEIIVQVEKAQNTIMSKPTAKKRTTDKYILVMSRYDEVCIHMLNLFNHDLRKYKEVKYEGHPEFDTVKWRIGGFILKEDEGSIKDGKGNKFTTIDINNDGKNETVLSYDICYRGVCGDGLFVFSDPAIDFSKHIQYTVSEISTFSGIQITPFWNYQLEADWIPKKYIKKHKPHNNQLRGILKINPFIFKNTYYVSIAEIYGVKYYSSGIVTNETSGAIPIWHIITEYKDQQIEVDTEHRTSSLKHVCYFQLVSQKNNSTKED